MSYFTEHFWGEKNHGFDVLYHNMKHGQISTKELADFVRERAAIEENYAKAMVKLSKMATNGTQLGTFAPLWEVFRISSDKLALCHLELMKKLHELIKDISRYAEEQGRVHKKSKEEVAGTLEAVQLLQGVAQLLPKSRESYHSKCQEYERLRREGTSQKDIDKAELKSRKAGEALRRAVEKYNTARAEFEQRMMDSAMRFQEVEEAHLRHMKGLIGSYSHSVEDTHVQIGQVHEEFKQNVQNIGTEALLRRFAESKGTGRERPGALDFEAYRLAPAQEGPRRSRSKAFRIPGLGRRERERDAVESPDPDLGGPEVDEDGFTVRPDPARSELDNPGCSSSDSDYDEEEPRKFRVLIKPLQPQEPPQATEEQLRATVGHLSLAPALGGTSRRQAGRQVTSLTPSDPEGTLAAGDSGGRGLPAAQVNSGPAKPPQDPQDPPQDSAALFGPPLESAFEEFPAPRSCSSPSSSSSSSPENVPDSGLDSPSHPPPGPSPDSRPWTPQTDPKNPSRPWTPQTDPKNSSRPWTPQTDPPNPSWTPQTEPPNPSWTPQQDPENPSRPWTPQPDPSNSSWTPQTDPKNPSWTPQADPKNPSRPWTPQSDPPNPPSFSPFGAAEGLWGVSGVSGVSGVAAPRARSRCLTEAPPSPDPFGDPPVWGEPPPPTRPSSHSSSSSSPAPPSGGGSCSPSPWGCPGVALGEGGAAGEAQPEPAPLAQRRPPGRSSRGPPAPLPHQTGRAGRGQQQRPVALAEPLALLELRPLALCPRQPERARLLHRGPAGPRAVARSQPGGAGLAGRAARGQRLHRVRARLFQGARRRQLSGEGDGGADHVVPRGDRAGVRGQRGAPRAQLQAAERRGHRAVPAQRGAAVQRPLSERPQHQGFLAEHGGAERAAAAPGGAEPRSALLQRGAAQVPVLAAGARLGPAAAGRELGLLSRVHPGHGGVRLQRGRAGAARAARQRHRPAAPGGTAGKPAAAARGHLEPGGEAAALEAARCARSPGPGGLGPALCQLGAARGSQQAQPGGRAVQRRGQHPVRAGAAAARGGVPRVPAEKEIRYRDLPGGVLSGSGTPPQILGFWKHWMELGEGRGLLLLLIFLLALSPPPVAVPSPCRCPLPLSLSPLLLPAPPVL